MDGVFDNLFGLRGKERDGALAAALARYPPNVPVHAGPAKQLDANKAEENLLRFLQTREARLSALLGVLLDHGVDAAAVLDPAADPRPAYAALSSWLASALPLRGIMPGRSKMNAPMDDYVASHRGGGDILFSFVADLALLEGEGIVRRRGDWRWDLDRDPCDAGTYPYRRIVLWRDKQEPKPAIALDLEYETLETVYAMRAPGPRAGHPLGRSLIGIVDGAFNRI